MGKKRRRCFVRRNENDFPECPHFSIPCRCWIMWCSRWIYSNVTPYAKRTKQAMFCLDRVPAWRADKFPEKSVAVCRNVPLLSCYCFESCLPVLWQPNSGLNPKTSLVIDDRFMILPEYSMTTINTHDMNSVWDRWKGDLYCEGHKEWKEHEEAGDIPIYSLLCPTNERLNNFMLLRFTSARFEDPAQYESMGWDRI